MKIYTKTGDDGNTGLQGGLRISKTHTRIAAYGAIDEANASLGVAISHKDEYPLEISSILSKIQNDLFIVGADLSNPNLLDMKNRVTLDMIKSLEISIDKFDSELPTLTSFILPGGATAAACLHHTRAIVRRAESLVIKLSESDEINLQCTIYLNRLSDLLFVLSRTINKHMNCEEERWHSSEST